MRDELAELTEAALSHVIEGIVAEDGQSVHPIPLATDEEREVWASRRKRKSGLVSLETRLARRRNAHARSVGHVGGKAKHRVLYLMQSTGLPRLDKRHRTLDGSPLAPHVTVDPQMPYEGRSTGQRPWTLRKTRRAANKRASRKRNR